MRAPLWAVERACTRKRSYATRAKARAGKALAEERHGKKLRIYHCAHCGGWHLATRKEPA